MESAKNSSEENTDTETNDESSDDSTYEDTSSENIEQTSSSTSNSIDEESVISIADERRIKKQTIKEFCKQLDLKIYYKKFVNFGIDHSYQLLNLTSEEIEELIHKLKMKYYHAKKFRNCLRQSQQALDIQDSVSPLPPAPSSILNHSSSSRTSTTTENIERVQMRKREKRKKLHITDETTKEAFEITDNRIHECIVIQSKCVMAIHNLSNSHQQVRLLMNSRFDEYKKQVDQARDNSLQLLEQFVHAKKQEFLRIQQNTNLMIKQMQQCQTRWEEMYSNGMQPSIMRTNIDKTLCETVLSNFTVPSCSFEVDFAPDIGLQPPILQPSQLPYYIPKELSPSYILPKNKQSSNTRHSLIPISVNSNQIYANNNSGYIAYAHGHSNGSPISTIVPANNNIRRNSVVLGSLPLTTVDVNIQQQQQQLFQRQHSQHGLLADRVPEFMRKVNQQQIAVQQQQQIVVQQPQQFRSMKRTDSNLNTMAEELNEDIKQIDESSDGSDDEISKNKSGQNLDDLRFVRTPQFWKQARAVQFLSSQATKINVRGRAAVFANIKISKNCGPVFWEIYVARAPARFWIGFLPAPYTRFRMSGCPPGRGFGIDGGSGAWYVGMQRKGAGVGRSVRSDDHLRFILDTRRKICCGSINDENVESNIFYEKNDIPDDCCICIISNAGQGVFEIRNRDYSD